MPRIVLQHPFSLVAALLLLGLVRAPVVHAQTAVEPLPSASEPLLGGESWYSPSSDPTQNAPAQQNVMIDERNLATCAACSCNRPWKWQMLPGSLLYQSYLAGAKESRFASFWAHDKNEGWIWDIALGGRVGLVRYGTPGTECPEGWQLDMEGAAFPRLDLESQEDLIASDFRFGVPLTYAQGPWETKLAVYHLSSHVGDEYMISHPTFTRVNYSRNALVWGQALRVDPNTRLYAEAEWAFDTDVGEPWAFQFGLDYSPVRSGRKISAPFAAFNGHLREEVDFGGNFVAQAGWQWKARNHSRLLRAGLEYYVGKSDQFEFFDQDENKVGVGLWYDY